jgi:hypothetical protein
MTPKQERRLGKIIVALAVFFLVFLVADSIWFPYTSEGLRVARAEAAGVHAREVVAPLLKKQKRFDAVMVSEWWKGDGYFWVRGFVDTEADLKDLKQLIIITAPPAPIAWDVEVLATNQTTNFPPH